MRLSAVTWDTLKQMLGFCFALAVRSAGMFCVSGLDIAVVGHYAFNETGYYAIAALPSNVVALVLASLMGPLMPAASALSTQRSPVEMGDILYRATRYSSILLFSAGLPLLVCAYLSCELHGCNGSGAGNVAGGIRECVNALSVEYALHG